MSARVMNALGATRARAHDLRHRGDRGHGDDARHLARGRPRGVAATRATCSSGAGTRCRPRRTCGASCSTRARPGARLVVVDPFRSRTARVADEHLRPLPGTDAALALGMMRAIVDAGLQDEEWCRAHTDGYDELLGGSASARSSECAAICGVRPRTSRASGREFATTGRRCCGSASGPSATWARRPPTARSPRLPALTGAWRDRGGGCSYIPTGHRGCGDRDYALEREDLRPGPVRTINMSQLGEALTDPALDPPVKALVCWNSNPAAIAPDQDARAGGPAPRRPVHGRARAVHDRHRRARRRGAARHHPARAPRRASSPGAITT